MRKIKVLFLAAAFFFGGMFFLKTENVFAGCLEDKCTGLTGGALLACREECARTTSAGNTSGSSNSETTFPNPLRFNSIQEVLTSLLVNLRAIVVTLCIVFIVLGGLLYITSAGNQKRIDTAKACITGAVIGFAIVLAAPTFLIEIKKILGDTSTAAPAGLSLLEIATRVLELLLSILGIIAIISIVIGGGMYLTAYGDEKKIDTAKEIIKYSILGIVVALGSLVIVRQIAALIGG
jgi:hypothetical protein